MFPYTVSPDLHDGKIGEVALSTTNVTDSGEGPSVRIYFTFTGKSTSSPSSPMVRSFLMAI